MTSRNPSLKTDQIPVLVPQNFLQDTDKGEIYEVRPILKIRHVRKIR